MVTTTPPANYLSSGVTDLNRTQLWSKLTDAEQAKYTGAASSTTGGTSTTGSATGTTGSTSTTTTTTTSAARKFVSKGTTSELSSTAFEGRTDARSAKPTAETLKGFGKLWATDALLQAQLSVDTDSGATAPVNGGAIFVDFKNGKVADSLRPYDGKTGNITASASLPRGKNPYGYFSTDDAMAETPFVALKEEADGSVTESTWSADTGKTYSEWLKTAKNRYDLFETLVDKEQAAVTATFGSGQGLLGYDVNNNGFIDDESELFGFDKGLNIDGSATIKTNDKSAATESFTFMTNGRLTGDPLDWTQGADTSHYRRFMVMGSDGSSTSVLQSQVGFSAAINQYVATQSLFTFGSSGAAITSVTQQGFKVTA